MAKGSGGEKTEAPTAQKKKKARKEGAIGKSPELGSWIGLLVATFVLPGVIDNAMNVARRTTIEATQQIKNPDINTVLNIGRTAAVDGFLTIMPLAFYIVLFAVLGTAVQGGIWISPKVFVPKLKKLNPMTGIKRMFGTQGLWNAAKAALKASIVCLAVYLSVRSLIPTLATAGTLPIDNLLQLTSETALRVLRVGAAAGIGMAIADYVVIKRRNTKSLKMTKEEVKEEMKSSEGNPQIKGAIRSKRLQLARSRMMADVPTADVVLVNPTHVAVALKYDPEKGAPRVVAKGADHLAARIREVAEEHRVPMVEDVPLARTLFQACDIGTEVPPDLYKAVATVLAFIMALKRRGSVAGTHRVHALPMR